MTRKKLNPLTCFATIAPQPDRQFLSSLRQLSPRHRPRLLYTHWDPGKKATTVRRFALETT